MSYEFRSGSPTLDLPNPYAVDNLVRFAVGGIVAAIGIGLLFLTRERLALAWNASATVSLIGALALLGYGVRLIAVGMTQLRFFFGRERPAGLANEIPPGKQGSSDVARDLQEIVRRGALSFPEPHGAINGLLYSWQRNLIYAPSPLQWLARIQFRTVVVVVAIFVSFILAWLLLGRSDYSQWLGLLYFSLTAYTVLTPLQMHGVAAPISIRFPVVLAVLAILGPVGLSIAGSTLPSLANVQLIAATAGMLAFTGVGAVLFFLALRAQLGEPPPASTTMHQLAVSMNCQPSQLVDELARRLQESWREQIPNRRYVFSRPDINLSETASGAFRCDMLEETQPFPTQRVPPSRLIECLKDPRQRWTLYLQLFGAGLIVASAVIVAVGAWVYTAAWLSLYPSSILNPLFFAGAGFIVGDYCMRGAHALFGRFDFESKLYWLECNGNFQVTSSEAGNVLTGHHRTRKSFVNIDTATLRVWVVDVYSVVFGKDQPRTVRAMVGRKDEAQALAESLAVFAQEQSIVVVPAAGDAQKIAAMARLDSSTATPLKATAPAALIASDDAT